MLAAVNALRFLAVTAAATLRRNNIFIPAIRYPTVARGAARLRITLTAAHSTADISTLIQALKPLLHPPS